MCLGRVVDRARGVYRSKARGLFSYDLATGEFGPAPEGVEGPRRRNARAARPTLAVSFGDAFLLDSFLRSSGLMACADACGHAEPDTVRAPLASQATTARPARRSASPASCGGTRACPSSATSPATRPAPPPPPAVESMPGVPRERHATGRDGRLVTTEPVRKTSEAHGAFGIRCPDTIGLPVVG